MNKTALGFIFAIFIPAIFTLIIHFGVYNKIKKKEEENIIPIIPQLLTYKLDLLPTYKPTISDILAPKP
jgi:hypothetical protein